MSTSTSQQGPLAFDLRTLNVFLEVGEFGALPARIAGHARDILSQLVENDIRAIAPWAEEEIVVG